jgi:3-hydroxyacyl-[acyl-carrier-protein] dehydratase
MSRERTIVSPSFARAGTLCGHGPIERADLSEGAIRLSTRRVVCAADPYMVGHFPGLPIWPGVFIVECARQLVLLGLAEQCDALELTQVRVVRFVMPLVDSDVMQLQLDVVRTAEAGFAAEGWCSRGDGRRAAQLKLGFVDRSRRHAA